MNRIFPTNAPPLGRAAGAFCLVLALTLPVFAEGESSADTTEKETYHIGTMDELLQLADYCRLDSWARIVPSCWTLTWN